MTNSHAPHIPSAGPPDRAVDARLPRVAICIPSGDTVCKGFAMSLAAMTYTLGQHPDRQAVPIALIGTEGSLIIRNRNEAVAQAQKLGVDYVLFLDSDMQFPPNTLRRLLEHAKDIVGATYVQREPPHRLLGRFIEGAPAPTTNELCEVEALPAGCLLIRLKVFDTMTRPYFRTPCFEAKGDAPEWIQGEDYYFCEVARRLGRQVWMDVELSMQLGHIGRAVHSVEVARVDEEVPNGQAVH